MTKNSKVLLVNLLIFTIYSVYGSTSRDVLAMMLLIALQFVVNLILGFTAREGKAAYFGSAFLVLVIGFAVCTSGF